jgi:protocatechuate 3,4-dioxygenase beta subunit/5-hydroxyisourate hydrolase-like protein (transthyretin family)
MVRKSQSIGSWLFSVARRMALAARRGGARRRECEGRVSPPSDEPPPDLTWSEVRDILHDEIEKLPEHYRLPVLLCYVEGKSREEAATQLDWTAGTFIGRLERGRKMLRGRLLRRGVGLAAVLLAVIGDSAAASVSPALVHDTIRAITRGEVAPRVLALLHGASPMILGKFKVLIALLLAAGVLAGAAGLAGAGRDKPAAAKDETKAEPSAKPAAPTRPIEASKELKYQGTVLDLSGQPIAGAVVKRAGNELARSDAHGRFEFTAAPEVREVGSLQPVFVTAEGHAPDWTILRDDPQLVFRLPDPLAVRGRLIDLEGKPIAKAKLTVRAVEADPKGDIKSVISAMKGDAYQGLHLTKSWHRPSEFGLPTSLETNAEGRFEVKAVGRGRILVLDVRADGFENITLRAVADEKFDPKELAGRNLQDMPGMFRQPRPTLVGAKFEHALRPTRPIVGTVRDAATGKPIAGVQVSGGVEGGWWEDHADARTDAQGRYKLLGLPKAARVRLMFFSPAGTTYLQTGHLVADAEGLGEVGAEVTMIRGVKLAGRVIDKATGKPMDHVGLHYHPLQGNKVIEASKAGRANFGGMGYWSDAQGRFNMTVAPGPGIITAATDDRWTPGAAYTQAVIRKEDRAREYNDPDGGFGGAFIGASGEIIALFSCNAYQIIDPPADAVEFKCELELDPGVSVNGKVVDAGGKPLSGAHIGGLMATWDKPQRLKVDSFVARAVNPQQTRTVAAIHEQRKLAGSATVDGKAKDMTLRLRPWGVLTGRAVNDDGKPIAGVEVRIFFRDRGVSAVAQERWSYLKPPKTDAEGRFRLEGIIPDQKFGISLAHERRFLDLGESFREMTVESGRTRDLGDVRCRKIGE